MSAHWAHTMPYGAFVSIRKGSPFSQIWHMVWQVETRLGISPYWLIALGKTQPDDGHHG